MKELFFEYNTIPYLYDTERLKLFQLKKYRQIEINHSETLCRVRLGSKEISRERAFRLALDYEK